MFKKEKKVKLTFHTYHTQQLIDMFPPKLAGQLVPDWFKTLKVSKDKLFPNMNSCPGMVDLFKNTINIPLWQDIRIKYDKGQIIDVDVQEFLKAKNNILFNNIILINGTVLLKVIHM